MRGRNSILSKALSLILSGFILLSPGTQLLLKADDATPPEVSYGYLTPNTEEEVSGVLIVDGNFNDNEGLAEIKMGLSDMWFCNFLINPENGYKECSIDSTLVSNGSHTISYWAKNLEGLETYLATRSINVNNVVVEPVDNTAPVFNLKDVTRDENESFPNYAEFVASNPEALAYNCSGLESGNNLVSQPHVNKLISITCTVTDTAGNQTTANSNLIVNNVEPQVVIIANPAVNVGSGSNISLVANILRGNGPFHYYWVGSCVGSGTQNNVGLTSQGNAAFANGTYLCGIIVTDSDGDSTGASVELNFGVTSLNSPVNSNSSESNNTSTSNINNESPNNTNTNSEPTAVSTPADVEGVSTDTPLSSPQAVAQSTNTTSSASAAGTSPLVIICLVAGGILIIGLLLFLFFRGEDDEEVATAQVS